MDTFAELWFKLEYAGSTKSNMSDKLGHCYILYIIYFGHKMSSQINNINVKKLPLETKNTLRIRNCSLGFIEILHKQLMPKHSYKLV